MCLTAVLSGRKWVAYSKLYQSLEVDSSVLFQQITSIEYHWHQQEPPHQQVSLRHTHSLHFNTFISISILKNINIKCGGRAATSMKAGCCRASGRVTDVSPL